MEAVLRTQGLCKHYRRFKALDGLDMEVPRAPSTAWWEKTAQGKPP